MDLDWTTVAAGPITLVRVRLRNDRATDRRVRLRNRLDGPVLPPRHNGTPEPGWDRDGLTTVVPAGETAALGYACPAPETEPPLEIDDVGAAPTEVEAGSAADGGAVSPADAVRDLGDHRPPRDVLGDGCVNEDVQSDGRENDPVSTHARPERGDPVPENHIETPEPASALPEETPTLPDDADALLARYRTRIETAEALGVAGVPAATVLLEVNDGLAGIDALVDELDSDAGELRALASVAEALAARAEAATPPTDALRRLS